MRAGLPDASVSWAKATRKRERSKTRKTKAIGALTSPWPGAMVFAFSTSRVFVLGILGVGSCSKSGVRVGNGRIRMGLFVWPKLAPFPLVGYHKRPVAGEICAALRRMS